MIEQGEATVFVGGKENRADAGDFFGEIALIDEGTRMATITAATDLVCYGITYWEFRPLVESNGVIGWKLLQRLAKILRAHASQQNNVSEGRPNSIAFGSDLRRGKGEMIDLRRSDAKGPKLAQRQRLQLPKGRPIAASARPFADELRHGYVSSRVRFAPLTGLFAERFGPFSRREHSGFVDADREET